VAICYVGRGFQLRERIEELLRSYYKDFACSNTRSELFWPSSYITGIVIRDNCEFNLRRSCELNQYGVECGSQNFLIVIDSAYDASISSNS